MTMCVPAALLVPLLCVFCVWYDRSSLSLCADQHMAVTRVPSTVCLRQYAFNSSATPLYHPVRNMASGNNLAGMPPASSAALLYNADINMSGAEIKFHLGEELVFNLIL